MEHDDSPMRVIICVCITDIPGNPQRRHNTLGDAFCNEILHRDLDKNFDPFGYDYVHIPCDFDSDVPLKRWFIFDLNVKEEFTTEQLLRVRHRVYLASRYDGSWYEGAKRRASSYTWGGRSRQERAAEARKQVAANPQ
ncbi:hypothetical protein PRK78_007091 [Emydomyces testavorans]|uniref:Uncharacterized protein n=1 Tax=Emydomyces testavorans TaxID=2070801 RepID=A0AAF0IL45_9EURO|nr:hypothetical protein PRK78_007091 [Emydomyces testavorans]